MQPSPRRSLTPDPEPPRNRELEREVERAREGEREIERERDFPRARELEGPQHVQWSPISPTSPDPRSAPLPPKAKKKSIIGKVLRAAAGAPRAAPSNYEPKAPKTTKWKTGGGRHPVVTDRASKARKIEAIERAAGGVGGVDTVRGLPSPTSPTSAQRPSSRGRDASSPTKPRSLGGRDRDSLSDRAATPTADHQRHPSDGSSVYTAANPSAWPVPPADRGIRVQPIVQTQSEWVLV